MGYTPPVVADFQARFDRDFPYTAGDDTDMRKVRTVDIQRGLDAAGAQINDALWESQAVYSSAYLLLAAHCMVTNLRNSSQGLNGQFNWTTNSKSVANVSESFTIPERVANNPTLASYTKTPYGAQYVEVLWPRLTGNVFLGEGSTTP